MATIVLTSRLNFQVLFNGLKAIGVEYHRHGVPRAAYASKEVILCVGTYISPMVLMMSGIGRKEQLDVRFDNAGMRK